MRLAYKISSRSINVAAPPAPRRTPAVLIDTD